MKTRNYFIIPIAAVLGFAVWYQDFDRRYQAREQAAAQAAADEKKRLKQAAIDERIEQADAARAELERRRKEKAAKAALEAAAQARREADRAVLAGAREEIAALRGQRQRLSNEIADEEARIEHRKAEQAALGAEQEFLQDYISRARESVARVEAVVAEVERIRVAAAEENAAAPAAPARRTR